MDDPLSTLRAPVGAPRRGIRWGLILILFSASLFSSFLIQKQTEGFSVEPLLVAMEVLGAAMVPFVVSMLCLRLKSGAAFVGLCLIGVMHVVGLEGRKSIRASRTAKASITQSSVAPPRPTSAPQTLGITPQPAPATKQKQLVLWPPHGHEFQTEFATTPNVQDVTVNVGGRAVLVQVAVLVRDGIALRAENAPLPLNFLASRSFVAEEIARYAREAGFEKYEFYYDDSRSGYPISSLKARRDISTDGGPLKFTFEVDFHYGDRESFVAATAEPSKTYPSTYAQAFLKSVRKAK